MFKDLTSYQIFLLLKTAQAKLTFFDVVMPQVQLDETCRFFATPLRMKLAGLSSPPRCSKAAASAGRPVIRADLWRVAFESLLRRWTRDILKNMTRPAFPAAKITKSLRRPELMAQFPVSRVIKHIVRRGSGRV